MCKRGRAAGEKHGRRPADHAIVMLVGDKTGRSLRGALAPRCARLHPRLVAHFGGAGTANGLNARRPLGSAMQRALSEALTHFALHHVPGIVREHDGTLIYAGGDDVLVLLSIRSALACAADLNRVFRQDWDGGRLLVGQRAMVSAGIGVVHYKEDRRVALQAAWTLEKQAKDAGRDALCLRVVRRSGEDSSAVVGWEPVSALQVQVDDFANKASNRWAHRRRAEVVTLAGLGVPRAELRLLLARVEQVRGPVCFHPSDTGVHASENAL